MAARYRILAGHPVPYALTVQRVAGPRLLRLSPAARRAAEAYLAEHLPGARITRTDGPYVFYALPAEGAR